MLRKKNELKKNNLSKYQEIINSPEYKNKYFEQSYNKIYRELNELDRNNPLIETNEYSIFC